MGAPERTCTVCRKKGNKGDFLRIVKTPDGEILLDPTGKRNGRGAYICKNEECFLLLKKTRGLDRSFKKQISTEIYDRLLQEVHNW